jgi:ribokinase
LTVVVVGDVATDVVVVLSGDPTPGSDRPASISTRGGGAAANVAVHLARLGTPVRLVGCVGDDPSGAGLTAELAAAGVRTALRTVAGIPTGTVVSLVEPGGQRSMLADRGANLELLPDDVPAFAAGGHLYLSGYTLLDPRPRAAGTPWPPAARCRSTPRPRVRSRGMAWTGGSRTRRGRRCCCPTPRKPGCSPGAGTPTTPRVR